MILKTITIIKVCGNVLESYFSRATSNIFFFMIQFNRKYQKLVARERNPNKTFKIKFKKRSKHGKTIVRMSTRSTATNGVWSLARVHC